MVARVSTPSDPRIANYRHIGEPRAMQRAGLFVAEGRWVVQRLLLRSQYRVRSILVTPTALAALEHALGEHALDLHPVFVVEQTTMDQIVGFNIHRGCLALAERPVRNVLNAEALTNAARIVVLEGVNNPDNVGGIFRSAAAFGVDLVVLGPACGDPLYRKAIRTSMASTLDVPYVDSGEWPAALDHIRSAGIRVLALTPDVGAAPVEMTATAGRVALVLGTEGSGLTDAAVERADERVRIAMSDHVDSLNVTVAASIAMHHFYNPP